MPYPQDRGSLSGPDYLLSILCAVVRQLAPTGELRIDRDHLLDAASGPIRLTKSWDEGRKQLVLVTGPQYSSSQVFTAETTWQAEMTQAAQPMQPHPSADTRTSPRSTADDLQQAAIEAAARPQQLPLSPRASRMQEVRSRAAAALADLSEMQPTDQKP